MNTKTPAIIFFVLLLIVTYFCGNEQVNPKENRQVITALETINHTEPLVGDGCEFVFSPNNNPQLKPRSSTVVGFTPTFLR